MPAKPVVSSAHRAPPWNFWLSCAAERSESDLTRQMRACLPAALKNPPDEASGRFAKLRAALSRERPSAAEWIEGLIDAGATPNAVFDEIHTALAGAAHHGFADRVAALLPHANAGMADIEGWTALSRAAAAGRADCVRLLLPACDDDARGQLVHGLNALGVAIANNHLECVEALLSRFDAREKMGETRTTALMVAAEQGNPAILEFLLRRAPDGARDVDGKGRDALMIAASFCHPACVKALLPVSDPLATNDAGHSALQLALFNIKRKAAAQEQLDCVRLLAPKSDLASRSREGDSPIGSAASSPRLKDCLRALLACADMEIGNLAEKETFLMLLTREDWETADLFAHRMPWDLLRTAQSLAPAQALPAIDATLERDALARALGGPAAPAAQATPNSENAPQNIGDDRPRAPAAEPKPPRRI